MNTRVFLVDDHPIVREGIGRLIDGEKDLSLVGEAEGAIEALQGIEAVKPDVVVVDLSLKESSGLDLIQDIKLRWKDMRVLVLSMYDEMFYAERVLRAGASGYVMKQEAPRLVITAIRRVISGGVYVSDKVSDKMLEGMIGPQTEGSSLDRLSDREMQVFQMIGEGLANLEVADQLTLSVKTVESHVERIKAKLGIKSGRELLHRAVEHVVRSQGKGPSI